MNAYYHHNVYNEDYYEDFAENTNAPALISRETSPAAETIYVQINLGLGKECVRTAQPNFRCVETLRFDVESKTGIFIPSNYRASESIDLVIYLHGHKSGFVRNGRDLPIDQLWDASRRPKFNLREVVNASGKNVILVAPTLGPLAQPKDLVTPTGFSTFVELVVLALKQHVQAFSNLPSAGINRIFLCAHSGGGKVMRQIARLDVPHAWLIKECWGFDCTYDTNLDPPQWYEWAERNTDKSLHLFSISGTSPARNANAIMRGKTTLPNVFINNSRTSDHNAVPQVHLAERLAAI